ncbi:MAG: YbbR-like domain-containing protein [Prevotella sp.]|nr:YbbR-like domain-containing protein [Prevotella sp.]
MVSRKLFDILSSFRNFLFSTLNREFLIFLFFLVISGTFWLLMSLNETYEKEIEVPLILVETPTNVVLTSDSSTSIRVVVKDKGYTILTYLYGKKIHPIKIDFNKYGKSSDYGSVSSSELQKLIYQQLYNSSSIVSCKPDKFEYYYNYGLKKRLPVRINGKILSKQSYYLSKVTIKPDTIDVYANREMLDSFKYVNTEQIHVTNITDTMVMQVSLEKIKGVKYMPDNVNISIYPDILTEESMDVPIQAINMPEGKILRTFPSKVTVTFAVGVNQFRSIRPEKFKVVVDYKEIEDNHTEKCNVYLRNAPHEVRNAKIGIRQVDYLIEEQ